MNKIWPSLCRRNAFIQPILIAMTHNNGFFQFVLRDSIILTNGLMWALFSDFSRAHSIFRLDYQKKKNINTYICIWPTIYSIDPCLHLVR